jgi:hypothetical protein
LHGNSDYGSGYREEMMKKIALVAAVALFVGAGAGIGHASQPGIELVTQRGSALFDVHEDAKALDEAIRSYLDKNPPEVLSASICSTVEKQLPATLPESDREKALRHVRANVTPEILKRMISAGLRRNFTVDEICVLSQYDESQLSDELQRKMDDFKYQVVSEIRLLLAATIS